MFTESAILRVDYFADTLAITTEDYWCSCQSIQYSIIAKKGGIAL